MDISALGLASSVNLGCVDFYPAASGKKNCCAYIAKHFLSLGSKEEKVVSISTSENILEKCICLCDDDNDLEMAVACGKVFLPSVTSRSMKQAVLDFPGK